jgi:hypothetical protein
MIAGLNKKTRSDELALLVSAGWPNERNDCLDAPGLSGVT